MFTDRLRAVVLRRLRVAIVLLLAAGTGAGAAERITAVDRQAIEQTVRRQLDAFGRDDAAEAFGIATPDIQRRFRSPDNFMKMVRDNYQPVYRPTSITFVRIDLVDGEWVQSVQLADGEGRVWRALFSMKRQPDKSWKVGGCQLVQTSALST